MVALFFFGFVVTPCVKLPCSKIFQPPDRQMTSDEMVIPKDFVSPISAVLETSGDGTNFFHVIDKGICT